MKHISIFTVKDTRMKIAERQLRLIVRKKLSEAQYYTSSGRSHSGDEAAEKFGGMFEDSSKIEWQTEFVPVESVGGRGTLDPVSSQGAVKAQGKFEVGFSVFITEPRGQEYTVQVFYTADENKSPYIVKEGLNPNELKQFISGVDSIVADMALSRIKKGSKLQALHCNDQ